MSEYRLTYDDHHHPVLLKDGEVVRNIKSVRIEADNMEATMFIKQYQPDLDFVAEGRVVTDKYLTALVAVAEKCKEYIKLHERGKGIILPDSAKLSQEKRDVREELSHKLYDAGYSWEVLT